MSEKCKCGHDEADHETVLDSDGYPHDWEQFCMGDDCTCNHYEPLGLPPAPHAHAPATKTDGCFLRI